MKITWIELFWSASIAERFLVILFVRLVNSSLKFGTQYLVWLQYVHFENLATHFQQKATFMMIFYKFWLLLMKLNMSGNRVFQASFVRSQLWIVKQYWPMRMLESEIALPGELCHGGFACGSVCSEFRENLFSLKLAENKKWQIQLFYSVFCNTTLGNFFLDLF